jgi:hypothetical protein
LVEKQDNYCGRKIKNVRIGLQHGGSSETIAFRFEMESFMGFFGLWKRNLIQSN